MKTSMLKLTAALLLAGVAGLAHAADCKVTVGVVMELTGPAGEYGQAGAKSVEMAFRDINDAGGVNVNQLMSSEPADIERLAGMARLTGIPVSVQPAVG